MGDEITTELDSYSLLEPIGEDTERELATFHLLVSSAASERSARQECAPATIQHGLQVLRHAATLVCCSTLRWSFVATCSAACNMP